MTEPMMLKDMPEDEAVEILRVWLRGARLEYFNETEEKWCPKKTGGTLSQRIAYRIAKTKPSVDWSHVRPEYNWLARDGNGSAYFYELKPRQFTSELHWAGEGDYAPVRALASYDPGTCDWKDSLVKRPEADK